ncbi:hypothetical protein GCM10009665_59730 [Kitasatospora nipponensis]|uniref:Uncharacterized protein n=1 Tax=Kitasatospora nipponensis TaxID=258049 RepID=A0ABN1WRW5_9ACTN
MKTTNKNTQLTGQTVVAASLRLSPAGLPAGGVSLTGVLGGLGLDATRVSAPGANGANGALRSSVLMACIPGASVETGLSIGWLEADVDSVRVMRAGRPTKAPKAVEAAAKHGAYLLAAGAGADTEQEKQQISQAKAAFTGAEAVRIRAFRGPEPWRERT